MSRRIVRLTVDHLAQLEAPCRDCLFWELDPVRRARVCRDGDGGLLAEKEAWVSHVLREWGSCGRVAMVDERPVGHLVYAPEAFVPGAAGFATSPVSPDAVLLVTAYVDPAYAGGGLGRMLVQGMARDLVHRGGLHAVEAFGDARAPARASTRSVSRSAGRPSDSVGRCLVPVEFLSGVGFKTQRAHPSTPRMRMDLRTALSWRDEVEAAVERLIGVVRPAPKPAPLPVVRPKRERSEPPPLS